uniref:Uncharacterized protein n=1 Tax=Steinernema glaseri TaxID=37863 RepID=A0A1I7ZPQ1_9BILA
MDLDSSLNEIERPDTNSRMRIELALICACGVRVFLDANSIAKARKKRLTYAYSLGTRLSQAVWPRAVTGPVFITPQSSFSPGFKSNPCGQVINNQAESPIVRRRANESAGKTPFFHPTVSWTAHG